MGAFLYNVLIRLYDLIIILASTVQPKARRLIEGRRETFKIIEQGRRKNGRTMWFHCASLGEYEQGLPVMESLKSAFPDLRLFVSFFSPSGYEIHRDSKLADCVFYLPADTRRNAERLLNLIEPYAVFFVKYEFWYHYLKVCYRRGIPVFSISIILRPEQVFFKFYGGFYRNLLHMFRHFFAQNEETRQLLGKIGLKNVTLSGDTRFDRVFEIAQKYAHNPDIEAFKKEDDLIVLGSTWKADIDLWIQYINSQPELKFIIAPHNIGEKDIRYIERKIERKTLRYSRSDHGMAGVEVLIIDNIGMLSTLYGYAKVSYVGGAFGEGLHNILEPAVYGKPILIGRARTNRKYQEAVSLLKEGGAYEISNAAELDERMKHLLFKPDFYIKACQASSKFVQQNLGSTKAIMTELKPLLS
jgi:3-deoxy-D-manno-octulosonic-acid transferase